MSVEPCALGCGAKTSIALPATVDSTPHAALTTMGEGFLPLVQYRGQAGASYRKKDERPSFNDTDKALQSLKGG